MNTPAYLPTSEPTRKALWLQCYVSLLGRLDADAAVIEADRALAACDARWRNARTIGTWQYTYNYPVGYSFPVPE
jgi:hypothetical protein